MAASLVRRIRGSHRLEAHARRARRRRAWWRSGHACSAHGIASAHHRVEAGHRRHRSSWRGACCCCTCARAYFLPSLANQQPAQACDDLRGVTTSIRIPSRTAITTTATMMPTRPADSLNGACLGASDVAACCTLLALADAALSPSCQPRFVSRARALVLDAVRRASGSILRNVRCSNASQTAASWPSPGMSARALRVKAATATIAWRMALGLPAAPTSRRSLESVSSFVDAAGHRIADTSLQIAGSTVYRREGAPLVALHRSQRPRCCRQIAPTAVWAWSVSCRTHIRTHFFPHIMKSPTQQAKMNTPRKPARRSDRDRVGPFAHAAVLAWTPKVLARLATRPEASSSSR